MEEEKLEKMSLDEARWIVEGMTDKQHHAFLKVLAEDPDRVRETIQVLSYTIAKMAISLRAKTSTIEKILKVDGAKWKATTTVVVEKEKEGKR